MLTLDSLVTDLIFSSGTPLDSDVLVEALGGKEELQTKQLLDPDLQDPHFEMEVSPSLPFRRRDERRLLIIDDSVAPMRERPREDPIVPIDLRPAKEALIEVCHKVPVRLGRLFALGIWADAVWVTRTLVDLRAICLLRWALDPNVPLDGRRRTQPISKAAFEEKLLAFDRRLEERNDDQIRATLKNANVEERDGLIIVDTLEADGTWDLRRSIALEAQIAAVDRFSTFVGAPNVDSKPQKPENHSHTPDKGTATIDEPPTAALRAYSLEKSTLVLFPPERFSLKVAAALGKNDWDSILAPTDPIDGPKRDAIRKGPVDFVAPVEFLSEVFVQGSPLKKRDFEAAATAQGDNWKTMEVHFPRFGPVMLLVKSDGSRFICSKLQGTGEVLNALSS